MRRIETFARWPASIRTSSRCASCGIRCRSCGSTILRSETTIATARRLWAYGTKTGRNAPGASQFVFGPAKWLRFLITPPPGRALVHRDFCQQEVRIAAVLSGDSALLEACESGDVYLGVAQQLGFLPDSLNEQERKAVRALFKTVVLGIQYGLGFRSLAVRTGISLFEAGEILARLRARFRRFEDYAQSVRDHAGLHLEIGTPFGWWMQCPSGMNPRTVRNFPMQSTGSEILHVACVLAERRGIEVVAPVHDAIMAEGPADQAEELSTALDQVMGDAAAVVLRGYRLPTDQPNHSARRTLLRRSRQGDVEHRHRAAGQARTGDGVMGDRIESLFEDAESDPLWQMAGLLADAPPRPAEGLRHGSAGMAGAGAAGGAHAHPARRGHADLPGVPAAPEQHCCSAQWRTAETRHQPLRQISGSGLAARGRGDRDRGGQHQALGAGDLALVPVAASMCAQLALGSPSLIRKKERKKERKQRKQDTREVA